MNRYVAEAIDTFALVFAGTTAIVVDSLTGGAVTHVGVALTFGLVVMTMIYAVGDVSGAHINPAVTLGFWAAGRLRVPDLPPYVTSQCAGALAASLTVRLLFPESLGLGVTIPTGGVLQSFVLEMLLTALLMLLILGVSTGAKEKGLMAGIAVGGTVALGALLGGPVSGASMNPARSLGPALAGGALEHTWIYLTAPFAGSILAVGACKCVRTRDCCSGATSDSGTAFSNLGREISLPRDPPPPTRRHAGLCARESQDRGAT